MARFLVCGAKPNPAPGEWNAMQTLIFSILEKLNADRKCMFVLIGHLEREQDEITGGFVYTVATLGRKLPPRLPPMFNYTILAKRTPGGFVWSTQEKNVAVNNGDLDIKPDLSPSFQPIIDRYRARAAEAAAEQT